MFNPTAAPPPISNNNFQANFNPSQFNQNAIGNVTASTTMPLNPASATMPREVAKEVLPSVEKLPIPEEHIHMQTVFDELRNQCSCAAGNPVLLRYSIYILFVILTCLFFSANETKIRGCWKKVGEFI